MRTYYKVHGYHEMWIHKNNKQGYEHITLIDQELLTANRLEKLGFSVHDLPKYIEKVSVKSIYYFFGARFEE